MFPQRGTTGTQMHLQVQRTVVTGQSFRRGVNDHQDLGAIPAAQVPGARGILTFQSWRQMPKICRANIPSYIYSDPD
jgi:hypothetical protein